MKHFYSLAMAEAHQLTQTGNYFASCFSEGVFYTGKIGAIVKKLLVNGFSKSEICDMLRDFYKLNGSHFFSSELSWFLYFADSEATK
jgi:hypothetical protein